MSTGYDVLAIARQMKAAQDEVRQIEPLTVQYPGFDVATAYDVSQWIHDARVAEGAVPVGRKIGFTNPQMWSRYGVKAPIWAYMYASTVMPLPPGRATFSLARFAEPKIEPEIVFHFRSAPPVDGDLAAILDSIDWVAHGFEIVQAHFPGLAVRGCGYRRRRGAARHAAARRAAADRAPRHKAGRGAGSISIARLRRQGGRTRSRLECAGQSADRHRASDRRAVNGARDAAAGRRDGHHGDDHHRPCASPRRGVVDHVDGIALPGVMVEFTK